MAKMQKPVQKQNRPLTLAGKRPVDRTLVWLLLHQNAAHKLRRPAPLAKISKEAARKGEAEPITGGALHNFYDRDYTGASGAGQGSFQVLVLTYGAGSTPQPTMAGPMQRKYAKIRL